LTPADRDQIIKRIDDVLKFTEDELDYPNKAVPVGHTYYDMLNTRQISQLYIRLRHTIFDLTASGSEYQKFAERFQEKISGHEVAILYGILKSLREDYAKNYLKNVNELIDADIFSDILEQSEYLRTQGYFRGSVVVAGISLESHLRKLAQKNSIPIMEDEKYVKAETLNTELYKKNIYDKTMHKSITSWLGMRNDAAHPDPKEINEGLIEPMIMGIRNLVESYPA